MLSVYPAGDKTDEMETRNTNFKKSNQMSAAIYLELLRERVSHCGPAHVEASFSGVL